MKILSMYRGDINLVSQIMNLVNVEMEGYRS